MQKGIGVWREKGSIRRCPSEATDFKCSLLVTVQMWGVCVNKGSPMWLVDVNLCGSISCGKRFISTSEQHLFFEVDSVDNILKRHH